MKMAYRPGPFDQQRSMKPALLQSVLGTALVGGIALLLFTSVTFFNGSSIDPDDLSGSPGSAMITRRRDATLALYVYNAADAEQARNFAFFLDMNSIIL